MKIEKYRNEDGQIAVLHSSGYGAGWYSWNTEHEGMLFDAEIVQAVLAGDTEGVMRVAERKYPGAYLGAAERRGRDGVELGLKITWLNEGDCFQVVEHDGKERVEFIGRCLVA